MKESIQQEELDRLIQKLVAGKATPEEKELLNKEFMQRGVGEQLPDENTGEWSPARHQSARMLRHLLSAIPETAPVRKMYALRRISAVAAACIAVVVTIALLYNNRSQTHELAAATPVVVGNDAAVAKLVLLADSTKVWLRQGASLQWQKESFAADRKVQLHGEAYFEVATDVQHPFRVYTDSLETTVLGTSFTIRENTMLHTVTVALLTGKVALHKDGGIATTLHPGQAAVYHQQTRQLSTLPVPWYTLAWKTGQLQCTDQPLEEVLDYLEQHYATPIRIQQSLKGKTFSGTLLLQKQLPVVLDRLLFVYGLQQKSDGDAIVIY